LGKQEKLLATKRKRELVEYKNSWIHKEVVGKIAKRIKAENKINKITSENLDEKKIFRAQGAIATLYYVLRIPDELEKEIG